MNTILLQHQTADFTDRVRETVITEASLVCHAVGRYYLVALTVPGSAQSQMTSQNKFSYR